MRILHVITSLRTGGAEHLMVDLLPRLRDMGNDVELLLFDGTRTPFYEQLECVGIKIHSLQIGGSVYNPRHILRLKKYLKHFDIVHTHNTAPQLFTAITNSMSFHKKKLVTTEHNTKNRRRDWRCYAPIDRWMYRQYKKIICISDKAEVNLRKLFYNDKKNRIITINNGVDTAKFDDVIPAPDIAQQFAGKHIIVMVAGFRYQKDHATLICAMSHLGEDYVLLLVGSGEKETECKALVDELNLNDRVHFLGIRTDVPSIMKTIDIMVLSSHWEGFGLAAVEGMAAGKPVIASDVEGLREVVNGYGIVFPHGNALTLAKEIRHLCENSDYYRHVAQRCQERAKQFDMSIMAQKYNELYIKLFS